MSSAILIGIIFMATIGAPIFAVLAGIAALGSTHVREGMPLVQSFAGELTRVLSNLATGNAASTLATIPLFTFAGYVMAEAKTAERLVDFAKSLVGWVPGGLAIVTILTCAMFTTFTGASGVTIVAIGALLLPILIKEGYKDKFALGLVTGTGSIGLLFPPSLPLIVYGIIYGMSAQQAADTGEGATVALVDFKLDKFLLAGIVPGLVLVALFSVFAVIMAIRYKAPTSKFDLRQAGRAFVIALPELFIPLGVVITIATGALQIPEAAAVTALYVVLIETLIYRSVKVTAIPAIARSAMMLVGAIMIIMVAATCLTDYFVNANVPVRLYAWMEQHIHSKYAFLLALNGMLLLVGCTMDIFSAILVVVPLIAPAAAAYGIDPYHLGIIFLLNLEIGYLMPPIGLNLAVTSFRFRKPMVEVYRAVLPFIGVIIVSLLIVTYVPGLVPIKAKAATPPGAGGAVPMAVDGGLADVKIVFPDGGVWTIEHCEAEDIKADPLSYEECKIMFQVYARCQALTDPLDKMECEQKVLEGGDPFTVDAGVPDGGAEADGGAAAADSGP